jgi:hypothetical protein
MRVTTMGDDGSAAIVPPGADPGGITTRDAGVLSHPTRSPMSPAGVTRLPISSDVQIAGARQAVRTAAVEAGFGLVEQTKLVTAASELARHGGGGAMELVTAGGTTVTVVAWSRAGQRVPR